MTGLIVQVEIEEVPVVDEPKKSHTGGGEQAFPDSVPAPLMGIAPGDEGIDYGNQSAEPRQNAKDLQEMDLEITGRTQPSWNFESVRQERQADHKRRDKQTCYVHEGTQAARSGAE